MNAQGKLPESSDVHHLPPAPTSEEDDALEFPPAPASESPGAAFAEFEDEMEGEATRIEEGHLLAEASTAILEDVPVQPFLGVEKGADHGREFVLTEGENGIGRGIDNDVILADVAVSRRHLRIIREGDVLRLRDLGSGNGTLVNGKRVSSMILSEGDRIEVGETILVVRLPSGSGGPAFDADHTTQENHAGATGGVMTPSDVFASMPQSPGYQPELTPAATATDQLDRTNPGTATPRGAVVVPQQVFLAIILGVALLLAMLGALVVVLVVRAVLSDDDEQGVTIAEDESPYGRGERAFREHRWDDSEAAFREALESGNDPRANDYLQRIRQAREHQQLIEQARVALASGDGNTAFGRASSVPADSPLAAEAQELRRQAQAQEVGVHVTQGRRALAAGDTTTARRHLDLARNLDAVSPLVIQFAGEIEARAPGAPRPPVPAPVPQVVPPPVPQPAPQPQPPVVAQVARPAPAPAPQAPSRDSSRDRRPAPAGASTASILESYNAGRFEQAAAAARASASQARDAGQRRELEGLASNIDRFRGLYGRAQQARFGASVRGEMEQAIALDRRISPRSPYRDRLRASVIEAHLADAQRQRSNPVGSCTSVRSALAVDSGNARARQMSAQCEVQARGMMREAAAARPDRATQIYRSVLLMVPNGSTVAREASTRLDQLRRRTAVDEDE